MIVEVSPRRAIDFAKSSDPMRYTNHSCAPNARLSIRGGRVEFYALRPIAPGEEITVDYGETTTRASSPAAAAPRAASAGSERQGSTLPRETAEPGNAGIARSRRCCSVLKSASSPRSGCQREPWPQGTESSS